MPAPTSVAPAYELYGAEPKIVTGQTNSGLLDAWYTQPHIPVANTAMGVWLMDQVGYTPPAPTTGGGTPGPTTGRGYPR